MSIYSVIQNDLAQFGWLSKPKEMDVPSRNAMKMMEQKLLDNGIAFVPEGKNKTRVVLNQSKHGKLRKCIPQNIKISTVWNISCPSFWSDDFQFDGQFMSQMIKLVPRAETLSFLEKHLEIWEGVGFIPYEVNTKYLLDEPGDESHYLMSFTDLHRPTDCPYRVSDEWLDVFRDMVIARSAMEEIAPMLPFWKASGMDVRFHESHSGYLIATVNKKHEFLVCEKTYKDLCNLFSESYSHNFD